MPSKNPSVLVVIVRGGPKTYCYDFYPRFAEKLDYPNKKFLLVDNKIYPDLEKETLGELVCGKGRAFGIQYAREKNFDYVYFLDLDLEPDPGLLSALVKMDYPLVGSLVAARGNPYLIIGHNYKNREILEREPLYLPDLKDGDFVDGISGASLLIHKTIFSVIGLEDYKGPDTIPGRFTADDEFLQINIYNKLKIKPKIILQPRSWHYDNDGYKYRILGKKEIY